ncbi:hypothetical protein HMPREF1982_03850 [Clostridiales bacterium oral taxon 876 str. F0540]|nr:hypothetical protein HMPREF1982_03850 [Clostridiales bacterium oral taxon 876 str. F0540]
MKIIKKRTIILMVVCICFGVFISYKLFVSPKKAKATWIVPNVSDISKKFITEDTLVKEIHQKQELITLEINMTEKVILDNSWGNFEIFKKVQSINYSGTGTYIVDLSNLKPENITIDNKDKKVTVNIPSPSAKTVNLIEEKTEYQTPENGLLRFGEIKLTSEENMAILKNVKDKMAKKMSEADYVSQAQKSSEQTLKNLVQAIMKNQTSDDYDIEITFK